MSLPVIFNNDLISSPIPDIQFHSGFPFYKCLQFLAVLSAIYLVSGLWLGGEVGFFQNWFFCCFSLLVVLWMFFSRRKLKKCMMWFYCLLPFRILSRYFGILADLWLPIVIRAIVFEVYVKICGVNVSEMEHSLYSYTSLQSFFTRRLRPDARIIDPSAYLVVPCDSTLVHCSRLVDRSIRQVKGLDYHVNTFLGYNPNSRLQNICGEPTSLFHCILYLAPGDYHRFHSPCDWTVFERSHFHGELLSVSPRVAKFFSNLFSVNERVVYSGQWKYGYFSYTVVGATNVGSIVVHDDPTLKTNTRQRKSNTYQKFETPLSVTKGEEFGLFKMGSTIVLVFEAPESFNFSMNSNSKVHLGLQLGNIA